MPRLVIRKGAGIGRDHPVGAQCVLGRAADVDLVLEDVGISRRHCRIVAEGASFAIEDLGSRNGTFLNGVAVVQRSALADGDVVRLGGIELVFRASDTAGAAGPVPAVPVAPGAPVPAKAVAPASARTPAVPSTPAAPAAAPKAPDPAAAPAEAPKKYDVTPRRRRTGW